jgi:quercetin dioxygenase-like cupin family protein
MPSAAETAPIVERIDTYAEWQKREEVPVVNGIYIRDMKTVPVGDWPRKGVKGSLIYLDGEDGEDVHLVEIPPGASTTPERHMYDEAIYVVSGRGTASVWYDERKKQTFEWGEGSFFCLPTNVNYQFFNISGSQPARYFSVTNLPAMLRQFHSEDFIFNCPFAFTDRYSGDSDYFSGEGKLYRGRQCQISAG